MKILHVNTYPNEVAELFDTLGATGTLRTFINTTERIATRIVKSTQDDTISAQQTFKGDMLEILAELFFNYISDFKIGNYTPINIEDDYGVDATGVNVNNHNVVVQVKYRSDPNFLIEYGEIANTFTSGVKAHEINPSQSYNVYVFTTAKDVNHICKKVLGTSLVVINKQIIKHKIDNDQLFWTFANQQIAEKL